MKSPAEVQLFLLFIENRQPPRRFLQVISSMGSASISNLETISVPPLRATKLFFLVINGGKLNITGTTSSYVQISKSGSAASDGQVDDDYNFYGINSGIVVSGSSSEATIKYANITTSSNGSNAIVDFPTRFAPSSKTAYLPSHVFFQSNSLSYAFLLNRIHSPFLDFIKQVDKIQPTKT